MKKNKFYSSIMILFFCGIVISLFVGQYPLTVQNILNSETVDFGVFFNLRVSRTIMAVLSGFGLAVSGYIYQTLFKNPIASPDIIGVSSGACAGAGFSIIFLGAGTLTVAVGAFLGGTIATFVALSLVALSKGNRISTFVISGIAINAVANAILMLLKMTADPEQELAALEFWTMGSLAAVTLQKVLPIVPVVVVCCFVLALLHRQITLLSLNSDEAKMLGVSVVKLRGAVLLITTLIVGGVVSITGLITFVGLIAPHITRLVTKSHSLKTMLFSGFLGSVIMLFSDTIARSISNTEIPISIITSLIGAPFLALLVLRGGKVE